MWFKNYLQLSCTNEQEINEAIAYLEGNEKIRNYINLVSKKLELLESETLALTQLSKESAINHTKEQSADLIKRFLEDENGHEINLEIDNTSKLLAQEIENLPTEEVFELRKAILKVLDGKTMNPQLFERLIKLESMKAQELKDLLVEIS
jgi:hypothetical protein